MLRQGGFIMKTKNKILTLFGLLGMTVACCFSTNKATDIENKENVQQSDVHPNLEVIKNFMALEHPVKMPQEVLREMHCRSVELKRDQHEHAVLGLLWHSSVDGLDGVIDAFFDACLCSNPADKLVAIEVLRYISERSWLKDMLQHKKNQYGEVPLVYAIKKYGNCPNFYEFFEHMIDYGFDIDVYSGNGNTLLDLAFKGYCKNKEIKQYLVENLTVLVKVKNGGCHGK
jgi:hypothetical protein